MEGAAEVRSPVQEAPKPRTENAANTRRPLTEGAKNILNFFKLRRNEVREDPRQALKDVAAGGITKTETTPESTPTAEMVKDMGGFAHWKNLAAENLKNPAFAGTIVSVGLGAIAAVTGQPYFTEASWAVGMGALGYGRGGETTRGKIIGGLIGSVGGLGGAELRQQVSIGGGGAVEAGIGIVDDVAVIGINSLARKGEQIKTLVAGVRKNGREGRMKSRPPVRLEK